MLKLLRMEKFKVELLVVGIGLFLYGIVLMSDSLKSFAGDKLRDFIDKYTSKPWQGILVGAGMTALIQSSTATTTITVGLVRAGVMSLEQAVGIIIGANIGTTFTAVLISLNIEIIAPYLICLGAFILMFAGKKKTKDIAGILIGFGCLFYGISLVGDTASVLKEYQGFRNFISIFFNNPLLGLVGGIVLTIVLQSSAATIGLLQIFYEAGTINLTTLLPFLFGSNIGTCLTVFLVSINGNVSSRRTSFVHLIFNTLGTLLGMIFLGQFASFINYLAASWNIAPMMQIAIVHIIFNVVTAILVYPFIKQLCALTKLIVPGEEPKKLELDISQLDATRFAVPTAGLTVAYNYIKILKDLVLSNVKDTEKYVMAKKAKSDAMEELRQTESLIDKLEKSIVKFLTGLQVDQLSDAGLKQHRFYLSLSKNLERMGDLTINIAEFGQMIQEDTKGTMSLEAYQELKTLFNLFYEMLDTTFKYVDTDDYLLYDKLLINEDNMDNLEFQYRENHFTRMSTGKCTSTVGSSVYADMLSNIERMGDHCCNIARDIFEKGK